MKTVFRQIPLYRLLMFCENEGVEKSVLDCGAGGDQPPLALFAEHGYSAVGIELSGHQIERAEAFCKENNLAVDFRSSDMRELPFDSGVFGCVYSYNSVFHMKKVEIRLSVSEMIRVLTPGGFLFVNLLSTDDQFCGDGEALGNNQFVQQEEGDVIHSFFEHTEADDYFAGLESVWKEVRLLQREFEGETITQGYIDYIFRKPADS